MSLKIIFLCFFLAVKTSRGAFLKNCSTEKQNVIIVMCDFYSRREEVFIAYSLKVAQSLEIVPENVTLSETANVTCLCFLRVDYYPILCKDLFNGSKYRDRSSKLIPISSLQVTQSILFLIRPKLLKKNVFTQLVLRSKHTIFLSNKPLYKLSNMVEGITWVKRASSRPPPYTLVCTDCRQDWTPFVDPRTNTVSSCYFVHRNYTAHSMRNSSKICESMGAILVSIETEEEYHFVQELLKKTLDVPGPGTWCRQQNNSVCLALSLKRHGELFRWGQGRPLVISPPLSSSLEESGDCYTWVLSRDETGYSGVWRQVDCDAKDRYVVICEKEKLRRENLDYINTRSEFVEYKNDLVSVAANLVDDEFYRWYLAEKGLKGIERFSCDDGTSKSLAYSYVCDNKRDCLNGRDEDICSKEVDVEDQQQNCSTTPCSVETSANCNISHDARFVKQFHFNFNDLCTQQANQQWNKSTIDALGAVPDDCTFSVMWSDIMACNKSPGFNRTMKYDLAPKCLYIKSSVGDVIGCRKMTHLQNCRIYRCPSGYAKCPGSYCVPEAYINDGIQDCPQGGDENNLMFKCFNTSHRIFLKNVCDGFRDCPVGDDEINCNVKCPKGVICVAGTATVSYLYSGITLKTKYTGLISDHTRTFDFNGINVDLIQFNISFVVSKLIKINCQSMHIKSEKLFFLTISENNKVLYANFKYNLFTQITPAGGFSKLKRLKTLDLSHNTRLKNFNLSFTFLESLHLSYTDIASFGSRIFDQMSNLRYLYMTGTKITKLNFLPNRYTLNIFDIRNTDMKDISSYYFKNIKIHNTIKTSNYRLCCQQALGKNTPAERCISDDTSISSCLDLVGDISQRTLLWGIGLLAVVGNSLALASRMIWDRKVLQTVYGQFVSNLCISDMIMGIYLIIIGVADEVYRDNYFVREEEWQYGVVCQVAGFLSTLSSEVTTFFICLITLDRFLSLRFQTGKYRFTTRTKLASIILSWLLGFSLALVPVLCPEWGIFTTNSMCLAFPLDTNVGGGRYYSVALFLGLNLILFLSILVGQIFIFRSLSARRSTSTFTNVNTTRRMQDAVVARQLSLVAVTNFLAWVPVQVMGALALAGIKLDSDVYTWTAVLILPMNSALNPAIYSLPKLYSQFQALKNWCRK